jgi:tetratricopeptide (TPR) repeat protein
MKAHVRLFLAGTFAITCWSGASAQTNADDDLPSIGKPPVVDQERAEKNAAAAEKAAKQTKPAFELAKDLDGLFAQLGKTHQTRRAKRISGRIWELWRESDSKSVDLLTGWANAAMSGKRYTQALDLLDQVIYLRPDFAEGYNQRATLHFTMENYTKSIADIERTLSLEPRHYGALSGLAIIFERLNQKDRALDAWYRTLAIYPAMKNAQDAVIRLEEELAGSGI